MKLLNAFCIKLYKNQVIFNSDEMKIFLSHTSDIKKQFSTLSNQNYPEMLLKYREAFPKYCDVNNN